eukprot:g6499.t1
MVVQAVGGIVDYVASSARREGGVEGAGATKSEDVFQGENVDEQSETSATATPPAAGVSLPGEGYNPGDVTAGGETPSTDTAPESAKPQHSLSLNLKAQIQERFLMGVKRFVRNIPAGLMHVKEAVQDFVASRWSGLVTLFRNSLKDLKPAFAVVAKAIKQHFEWTTQNTRLSPGDKDASQDWVKQSLPPTEQIIGDEELQALVAAAQNKDATTMEKIDAVRRVVHFAFLVIGLLMLVIGHVFLFPPLVAIGTYVLTSKALGLGASALLHSVGYMISNSEERGAESSLSSPRTNISPTTSADEHEGSNRDEILTVLQKELDQPADQTLVRPAQAGGPAPVDQGKGLSVRGFFAQEGAGAGFGGDLYSTVVNGYAGWFATFQVIIEHFFPGHVEALGAVWDVGTSIVFFALWKGNSQEDKKVWREKWAAPMQERKLMSRTQEWVMEELQEKELMLRRNLGGTDKLTRFGQLLPRRIRQAAMDLLEQGGQSLPKHVQNRFFWKLGVALLPRWRGVWIAPPGVEPEKHFDDKEKDRYRMSLTADDDPWDDSISIRGTSVGDDITRTATSLRERGWKWKYIGVLSADHAVEIGEEVLETLRDAADPECLDLIQEQFEASKMREDKNQIEAKPRLWDFVSGDELTGPVEDSTGKPITAKVSKQCYSYAMARGGANNHEDGDFENFFRHLIEGSARFSEEYPAATGNGSGATRFVSKDFGVGHKLAPHGIVELLINNPKRGHGASSTTPTLGISCNDKVRQAFHSAVTITDTRQGARRMLPRAVPVDLCSYEECGAFVQEFNRLEYAYGAGERKVWAMAMPEIEMPKHQHGVLGAQFRQPTLCYDGSLFLHLVEQAGRIGLGQQERSEDLALFPGVAQFFLRAVAEGKTRWWKNAKSTPGAMQDAVWECSQALRELGAGPETRLCELDLDCNVGGKAKFPDDKEQDLHDEQKSINCNARSKCKAFIRELNNLVATKVPTLTDDWHVEEFIKQLSQRTWYKDKNTFETYEALSEEMGAALRNAFEQIASPDFVQQKERNKGIVPDDLDKGRGLSLIEMSALHKCERAMRHRELQFGLGDGASGGRSPEHLCDKEKIAPACFDLVIQLNRADANAAAVQIWETRGHDDLSYRSVTEWNQYWQFCAPNAGPDDKLLILNGEDCRSGLQPLQGWKGTEHFPEGDSAASFLAYEAGKPPPPCASTGDGGECAKDIGTRGRGDDRLAKLNYAYDGKDARSSTGVLVHTHR